MAFFDLPSSRATTKRDKQLLQRAKKPVEQHTVKITGSGKLIDRIQSISALVKSKFAGKEDDCELIQTEEHLISYISDAIKVGRIAIDTETTGLDPILDDIVGMSIYTDGRKCAYIPINHVSYITNIKCADQLPVEFVSEQIKRLLHTDIKIYMFNAPFDIRVIGSHLGVWLTPYFDGYIAARLMDNHAEKPKRGENALKKLYTRYCLNGNGEALTFDEFFKGIPFQLIPINVGYLYAAYDAKYTMDLCDFFSQYLEPTGQYYESHNMSGMSNVFFNIEMASMPTFIQMEQTGVAIDYEYAEKLSERYHAMSDKMEATLMAAFEPYKEVVADYRRTHPRTKITDPINLNSTQQLAELLYDVFRIKPPDPKKPRGVDGEILEQIDHPICSAILDSKAFKKAISTYIDKIPEDAKQYPDKRIHCKFNQYGAATGRVSSDSPNLQNIPSKEITLSDGTVINAGHDIRQMFMATPGYTLLSCDYSGQEVRVTAHLAKDEKLIAAYNENRDPYSEVATVIFNRPYEDCCEKNPDGTKNHDGKLRRSAAKPVTLGIMYDRGIASIGEALGKTKQEAQRIYDNVLSKFTGLAQFIKDSRDMARKYGYVTTIWGRRRQIPDMQLPYFEFSYANGVVPEFDPLSDDDYVDYSTEVPEDICRDLTDKLLKCNFKERDILKQRIIAKGINIKDNCGYIAKAQRQCVNSRVQGSSADLTKLAQIELANCKELKDLGFRMLIPVHDEIIGECPIEVQDRCAELMSECMIRAGKDLCVPLKCDVDRFTHWYMEEDD